MFKIKSSRMDFQQIHTWGDWIPRVKFKFPMPRGIENPRAWTFNSPREILAWILNSLRELLKSSRVNFQFVAQTLKSSRVNVQFVAWTFKFSCVDFKFHAMYRIKSQRHDKERRGWNALLTDFKHLYHLPCFPCLFFLWYLLLIVEFVPEGFPTDQLAVMKYFTGAAVIRAAYGLLLRHLKGCM